MIEHREECRDENDGRQYLEGEDHSQVRVLFAELSKDHLRSYKCVGEKTIDAGACFCEQDSPQLKTKDEDCEENL